MADQLIVIETGYKNASANYDIHTIGPLPEAQATERFRALMAGTAPELREAKDATVVEVSDNQFLRLRHGLTGALILDRVTRGAVK